jgi:hypothetical protein
VPGQVADDWQSLPADGGQSVPGQVADDRQSLPADGGQSVPGATPEEDWQSQVSADPADMGPPSGG